MDRFYTPPDLAQFLASTARAVNQAAVIADFSAGTGELLLHAERRWPKCEIVANDIDGDVVRKLRRMHPSWSVANCNFLDDAKRGRNKALKNVLGRVNLCLLNPPFSCRGNQGWKIQLKNETLRCGLALKFVLTALEYLAADGELLAILPSGTLQCEKDSHAWQTLSRWYAVSVIAENSMHAFQGCLVRTVVVRISQVNKNSLTPSVVTPFKPVEIIHANFALRRGVISMTAAAKSKLEKSYVPFVHTTELKENSVCLLSRRTSIQKRTFVGPCILISRVGRPDHRKLALYLGDAPIALSECVICIECDFADHAFEIFTLLSQRWSTVAERYGGTCARYLTISNLKTLLIEFGFSNDSSGRELPQGNELSTLAGGH